jgi:hypothetical protein
MTVQLSTRVENSVSASSMNMILVTLLNGMSSQQSHRKEPPVGIRGTVKGLTAKTSSQRMYSNKNSNIS